MSIRCTWDCVSAQLTCLRGRLAATPPSLNHTILSEILYSQPESSVVSFFDQVTDKVIVGLSYCMSK